jgi:hypothetical protein
MSRIFILNKSAVSLQKARVQRTSATFSGRFLGGKKAINAGSARINLVSLVFTVVICTFMAGAFYLYQVNNIATKSYEIRDLESQIQELSKESKKMEIREVELRSMYNIEKASQDLNLVNSADVTYVEMSGPVAMK